MQQLQWSGFFELSPMLGMVFWSYCSLWAIFVPVRSPLPILLQVSPLNSLVHQVVVWYYCYFLWSELLIWGEQTFVHIFSGIMSHSTVDTHIGVESKLNWEGLVIWPLKWVLRYMSLRLLCTMVGCLWGKSGYGYLSCAVWNRLPPYYSCGCMLLGMGKRTCNQGWPVWEWSLCREPEAGHLYLAWDGKSWWVETAS